MERNLSIKAYARQRGVKMWQIAERYGIHDATLSRWLRKEFSPERAQEFRGIVDEISASEGR